MHKLKYFMPVNDGNLNTVVRIYGIKFARTALVRAAWLNCFK